MLAKMVKMLGLAVLLYLAFALFFKLFVLLMFGASCYIIYRVVRAALS